jgi:hypothetical protein
MDRDALIEHYRTGYDDVIDALAGTTDEDLDRRPAPDAWTSREIVHHLADSETRSYLRLREILTGDPAVVQAYAENHWVATLPTYRLPIAQSLVVLQAVRLATEQLIDAMTDADWAKETEHSEAGRFSADTWLEWYANHPHDHADQIRRARRGEV